MTIYHSRLLAREHIARDTVMLALEKPRGFEFRAGQYSLLRIPDVDETWHNREFSIASAPHEESLHFAMRVRGSIFKHACMTRAIGADFELAQPQGEMVVDDGNAEMWIAGGIGTAPLRSMLRDLIHHKEMKDIRLLCSARTREDLPFLNEFEAAANAQPRFSFVPIFTRERSAEAPPSRITRETIEAQMRGLHSPRFRIVGTRPFVAAVREAIASLGVPASDVKYERFCGYTQNDTRSYQDLSGSLP